MSVIIKVRRGTTTQWNASTYVLQSGEIGLDTTLNKIKVGNGTALWTLLPFVSFLPEDIAEFSQDAIDSALSVGPGLTKSYNDSLNSIEINLDGIATQDYVDLAVSGLGDTVESGYVPLSSVANPGGIATLDLNGFVPDSQISSSIARDSEIITSYNDLNDKPDLTVYSTIASPTFTGTVTTDDLVVDGDFTVNGQNFAASATSIVIEDNMVQLAHQNSANTVDLGIVVAYNDGASKHSGIVRDVSSNKWKIFKGVTTEPSTTVDFTQGSLDDLEVAGFTASSITTSNPMTFVDESSSVISTITGTPGPTTSFLIDSTNWIGLSGSATHIDANLYIGGESNFGAQGTPGGYNLDAYLDMRDSDNNVIFTVDASLEKITLATGATQILEVLPSDIDAKIKASARHLVLDAPLGDVYLLSTTSAGNKLVNKTYIDSAVAAKSDLLVSINQQTSSYTLVSGDNGKMIEMSGGGTLTVPSDAVNLPIGTVIDILQTGSSQVTVAGSGATVNGTPGLKLRPQWSSASLIKRAANTWVLIGDLSA